jgi:Holliday junction DNA helicase RuvA
LGPGAGTKGVKLGTASIETAGVSAATRDATSALINLGYSPSDALSAVSHAASKLGEDANVGQLIKGGLAELGPHNLGSGEHG